METTSKIPNAPNISNKIILAINHDNNSNKDCSDSFTLYDEVLQKTRNIQITEYNGEDFINSEIVENTEKSICDYCGKEIETLILQDHQSSHPSKILDHLYLGSYNNAVNDKELKYAGINYILNCAIECENTFQKEEGFTYKKFDFEVRYLYN
jgi:hypothetical protein